MVSLSAEIGGVREALPIDDREEAESYLVIGRNGGHFRVSASARQLLRMVDAGLGFPATYRGSARTLPALPLSARDEQLIALAQTAVLRGGEVSLDDKMISALSGEDTGPPEVPLPQEPPCVL